MGTQHKRSSSRASLVPGGTSQDAVTPRPTATALDAGQAPDGFLALPPFEAVQAAFPQLELIEFIGQGGMGAVYKARQPGLDRFVALKVLRPSLTSDTSFAERFSREARAMARLNHPQIVSVYDCGQSGGLYYLLMEFVDGSNLRQAMRSLRINPQQALSIISGLCEALQFAHDAGVTHRDIKPENILLDARGRAKIADFGMARLAGDPPHDRTITASGIAMGTPHYMAPEQFDHPHDVDQRADIYSLGVVLYEALTGELPIGRFPPPSRKSPLDPGMDEVVLRALESEPDKRYRSAGELKAGVDAIAALPPAGIPRGAAQARLARPEQRAPAPTSQHPKRPLWWTLSAWLFIAIGLFALLDTLASLYSRPMKLTLSPGLAHLIAGVAMLTLDRRWRIAALGALALAATAAILITVMIAVAPERAAVMVPGSDLRIPAVESPRWAAAAAIVVALLLFWPIYALLSRRGRTLFIQSVTD